ncbi:MAG TPA: immunoglobulin domain-containing protein [Bryobacteraceae bacterium]|nr:immunoglobulin domain-containing protein [Bryobacteraceae bacterium]
MSISRLQLGVAVTLFLASIPAWPADATFDLFYTQYGFQSTASVNKVHVQYYSSNNTLFLSGNTTLYSGSSDSTFGADGIQIDPNTGNLLVAGGGTPTQPGYVYQLTQTGAQATPYSVTPDGSSTTATPRAYSLTIIPANATKAGFPPNYLLGLEKDFGYGRISIMPLEPSLGNGIAYPVIGDDVYVTGIAFTLDGTAYYGSGSEESGAGNFGLIYFDGKEFITHRLFGQPVGNDPRGGIIYTGTHRLAYDPFTGDIFAAGGNAVGQYDPSANVFHTLTINGTANGFEFSTPILDGNGHVVLTACCGTIGDSGNGAGDIVVVDYTSAPQHRIDAPSGVQYQRIFLATNLGAGVISNGPPPSLGPPLIQLQPSGTSAIIGQSASFTVGATGQGLTFQWQSKPSSASSYSNISGATSSTYVTPPVSSPDNGTQFICLVTDAQGQVSSSAARLTVLPPSSNYVTSTTLGTLRNNYSGWVGMSVTTGAQPIAITALGRIFVSGNTGTHVLKIVQSSTGTDVPGTSVTVSTIGGVSGNFVYANLAAPVTLNVNTTYYVLSQEAAGGDQWYDYNTSVQSTSAAVLGASVYGPPYTLVSGSAGHSYVPVDFKYAASIAVSVNPSMVTLPNSGTQQFSAMVTGTTTTGVTWSIVTNPPVGTLTSDGFYTAPSTISSNQSVTIAAASVADTSKSGLATVNLVPPSPPTISQQPQNATVTVGQTATFTVVASGGTLSYQWESQPSGAGSFSPIGGATSNSYTTPAVTLSDSGTQYHCIVTNAQGPVTSNAALLNVSSSTPFVTGLTLGTLRNDYSGWVGMSVAVGNVSISVTALGRFIAPGNSGMHTVKIVNAGAGTDVPGGSVMINTAGQPSGAFAYVALSSPVTLNANTGYYILSQEIVGGDQWYDLNTSLQNHAGASITAPVYGTAAPYSSVSNLSGHSYIPVDFQYTQGAPVTSTFVTSVTAGTARNDFIGWVGGSIITGSAPVQVTHLGRLFLAGNTGTHAVKIVNASGVDVPGASVSVNLSGGIAGSFNYAALASPVTLNPNTTYYIVSQESSGGDQWYDYNTAVHTNNIATLNGAVYSFNGTSYVVVSASGHMYVPVDFKYQ